MYHRSQQLLGCVRLGNAYLPHNDIETISGRLLAAIIFLYGMVHSTIDNLDTCLNYL